MLVFVIGDVEEKAFESAIDNLEEQTAWDIHPMQWTEQAFLQNYKRTQDFIKTLRNSHKEWLAGDEVLFESLLNQLPD